jgi:endo-1,4-beta-mannosidase
MARFLIGVNYWPRSSAMAMWSRFDIGEIDADFARMAALGFDVVRFFLTWETFQPEPLELNAKAADDFIAVLDRAAAHGLRAIPTLFSGHMSGVNWLPEWALDQSFPHGRFRTISGGRTVPFGIGDFYTGELLEAQRFFVRAIGERAREHAAILVWDLGNEFSNLRAPQRPADAAHWAAALAHDLADASNLGTTAGTHGEDLSEDRAIRLSSLFEPLAFGTMHGYPAYSAFARGPADTGVVPFLYDVAGAFAAKRIFFTEFGTPVAPAGSERVGAMPALDDEAGGRYAAAVLPLLRRRGALGALWWCWTDYAPELSGEPPFDQAPHELRFGLLRDDGTERPAARALADFARSERSLCEPSYPAIDEEAYYAALPEATEHAFVEYLSQHETRGVEA